MSGSGLDLLPKPAPAVAPVHREVSKIWVGTTRKKIRVEVGRKKKWGREMERGERK
jgi:hypothetical protein